MPADKCAFADSYSFLRYLTNDIPEQASAFEQLLLRATAGEFTLVTNSLVVAEMVWTMESYYQIERTEIHKRILAMFNTPGLQVENSGLIIQALMWYADENVDYADAYNAAWALDKEMHQVYTFDKKHFQRMQGVDVLVPESR